MDKSVAIIGAGIMGLTLAYRLSQNGYRVVLIESGPQIGGLSTWFDYGTFTWDKYYHVILKQDEQLLKLIHELGIANQLQWRCTKTGFLYKGDLFSMSNNWEFLRFPPLNLLQKGRLGLGILYSHYIQNPKQLQGITAKEWLTSIFGTQVYAAIWEPLLESKFGALKEQIPATIIWATINRYFSTRTKADGKEWMGYLSGGGLKVLIDAMQKKILANGGEIHTRESVTNLDQSPLGAVTLKTSRTHYTCTQVISTIPYFFLKTLTTTFDAEYAKLGVSKFFGVIRLALLMSRSLTPYYVTNLIDKGLPYTGIVELSQVVDKKEFDGKSVIMLPRYDLPDSPWFQKSDQEVTTTFLGAMRKAWPTIDQSIQCSYVHRERIVQGVYLSGSPPKKPLKSDDRKVWSINAELIGDDNLNNNAIIRVAESVVEEFMEQCP